VSVAIEADFRRSGRGHHADPGPASKGKRILLALLDVRGVFAKPWAVLAEFELRLAAFATNGVVVVASLFADQMNDFDDLFLLGHGIRAFNSKGPVIA
jgi:hypothetical protein